MSSADISASLSEVSLLLSSLITLIYSSTASLVDAAGIVVEKSGTATATREEIEGVLK